MWSLCKPRPRINPMQKEGAISYGAALYKKHEDSFKFVYLF